MYMKYNTYTYLQELLTKHRSWLIRHVLLPEFY